MSTTEIREKLHHYINQAEDKKVKAIYTMVEREIETSSIWNDDAFVAELERRAEELESGKVKGLTWEEVQAHAQETVKARKQFV